MLLANDEIDAENIEITFMWKKRIARASNRDGRVSVGYCAFKTYSRNIARFSTHFLYKKVVYKKVGLQKLKNK